MEKNALNEWEDLLLYFKKLEKSSCKECLFWYSRIKAKTFHAKCSKNVPGNKKRLNNCKNELQKHLQKENFHERYYIKLNQSHPQHLFHCLRILKNKL